MSLALSGCALGVKSELDSEAERLCAIDGGVKVYEKVMLPARNFDRFGNVPLRSKEYATPEDQYYLVSQTHYYRQGNPGFWRTVYQLIRRSDGKVLGESVYYARRGGDMRVPSPRHESSFSCPKPGDGPGLDRSVFVNGG